MRKRWISTGYLVLLLLILPCQRVQAKNPFFWVQERVEVDILLREYYKACSEGDTKRAKGLIAMQDLYKEERMGVWAKECGMERYDITSMYAYLPGREEGIWLIYVEYEMVVSDFDVTIPGSETFILRKGENGWEDCYGFESETTHGYIEEIAKSEEYLARIADVNRRFNELMEAHPELMEWAYHLKDVFQYRMVEQMMPGTEDGSGSANAGEDDGKAESYLVQKGDCLWEIARKLLGDGMQWTEIYESNREAVGDNPNLIYPDTQLWIP